MSEKREEKKERKNDMDPWKRDDPKLKSQIKNTRANRDK